MCQNGLINILLCICAQPMYIKKSDNFATDISVSLFSGSSNIKSIIREFIFKKLKKFFLGFLASGKEKKMKLERNMSSFAE